MLLLLPVLLLLVVLVVLVVLLLRGYRFYSLSVYTQTHATGPWQQAQPARATSDELRAQTSSAFAGTCPPPPSAAGGRRCSGTGAWLWRSSQEHPSAAVVARARLLALGIRRFCVDRWRGRAHRAP